MEAVCVSYCLCCLAVGLEGVHLMHQLRHTLVITT